MVNKETDEIHNRAMAIKCLVTWKIIKNKLAFFKNQSVYSVVSLIFGLCGIFLLIDGVFIVPLEMWRWGLYNASLNASAWFLMGSLVFMLMHKTMKKDG